MEQTELNKALRRYALPETKRSIIQTSITLGMYLTSVTLMTLLLYYQVNAGIVIVLSLLSSPIIVKIFIIFHDCGHTSYLKSSKACVRLGHILGVFVFTAYYDWQKVHATHHRFMGDLEQRGVGDVWLMTVDEYNRSSNWTKFCYRLYRHPLFILFIIPPILFLIINRFPSKGFRRRELQSIIFTDIMIALMIIGFSYVVGWKGYLLMFLPMMIGASTIGVWLFYIQHQFRSVYWSHSEKWDRYRASMEGSSFYTMPGFLRWSTGNIGYHHIHHLAPRIPNYKLKECFDDMPALQDINPIPYLSGFRNLCLSLWDEKSGHLISFKEARKLTIDSM